MMFGEGWGRSPGFLLLLLCSACFPPPAPQYAPPAPVEGLLDLPIGSGGVVIGSIQAPGRRHCSSVVVLNSGATVNEEMLSLLEGDLISKGLRVVSSGITGRVVSAPERLQEGAAKLPPLERALVLAKEMKANCLFQLFRFQMDRPDWARYFIWPYLGMKM